MDSQIFIILRAASRCVILTSIINVTELSGVSAQYRSWMRCCGIFNSDSLVTSNQTNGVVLCVTKFDLQTSWTFKLPETKPLFKLFRC